VPIALAELVEFVRARLVAALGPGDPPPHLVVVAAGPPFAASPYARARLLRQLHATGAGLDPGESGRS
jgi:hypothetical protein